VIRLALALAPILLPAALVAQATPTSTIRDTSAAASLVAAELAFARRAAESDVRTAFLEVLASDAVVFRPGVVEAREWYQTHASPPIALSWSPAAARAARAGDLGYTTGPYRARALGGARDVGAGYYLSIWRRERGREWQLLMDLGVETDAPDEPLSAGPWQRGAPFPDAGRARAALLEADDRWSRRGSRPKDAEALADPQVRVLRNGRPLARGVTAAAEAMAASTRDPGGAAGLVAVSASLDFGFTRGMRLEAARGNPTRVHYVRVWVTDAQGAWRILADVETPEPAGGA
jgi:ketosteroid isomerase-like protein